MDDFKHIAVRSPSNPAVAEAVKRMRSAPRFLTEAQWDALSSYQGPVQSGNPAGLVRDDLEENDE